VILAGRALLKIHSQFGSVDLESLNGDALTRVSQALLRGLEWFRFFHPDKIAYVVLDEVTFLIPRPSDKEDAVRSKNACFRALQDLAITLAHDSHMCRFVVTSSTPEIFKMNPGRVYVCVCVCVSVSVSVSVSVCACACVCVCVFARASVSLCFRSFVFRR
jgi:hypothetical protein